MAKHYRGRQRMISQAIIDSADFDGLSLAGTVLWDQMVIAANDDGVTCIDAAWCKRRYFHRRGINRVTIRAIQQAIHLLIHRGILHPIPHPMHTAYDIQSPLSHAVITKFRTHNRVKCPGRRDETRRDKTSLTESAREKSQLSESETEVVEAMVTLFRTTYSQATEAVRKHGHTKANLDAWIEVFRRERERNPRVGSAAILRADMLACPDPKTHPIYGSAASGGKNAKSDYELQKELLEEVYGD